MKLNNYSLILPCHDEKFANHARAFTYKLLYQLGARHSDEGAVGVMGYSASQQSFT